MKALNVLAAFIGGAAVGAGVCAGTGLLPQAERTSARTSSIRMQHLRKMVFMWPSPFWRMAPL